MDLAQCGTLGVALLVLLALSCSPQTIAGPTGPVPNLADFVPTLMEVVERMSIRAPAVRLMNGGADEVHAADYFDEAWGKLPLAERQEIYLGQMKLAEELTAKGLYLGGHPLQPPATSTTVRVREGKRLLTDGAFAETREHLGGFMLVDVPDLDAALDIAARGPVARVGIVEVRPVREGPPTAP